MKIILFIEFLIYIFSYNRKKAVDYAYTYTLIPNHNCGYYNNCTPCSYLGDEICNYIKHGGDSANFVSQCIVLGGGHPKLNDSLLCNGYPCGFEVTGQKELGDCLQEKGWISTCGYHLSPPSYIMAGDVIIYHSGECNSTTAHAAFITESGKNPKIAKHSSKNVNVSYNIMANVHPYYQWLHYNCSLTAPNGECVSACSNETYLFSLNNSCLESCPHNYEEYNNECIFKSFDENTTIDEFKNQVSSNISSFGNFSEVITGKNFIATIILNDDMDPKEQLKKGISAIDLGNCINILKEYYNISKNESLIILNMELKNEINNQKEINNQFDKYFNLGKSTQIEVYDYSGTKLDLSICKQDIKVIKYIGDVEQELDMKSAMDFANLGIDIFNPEDKFFNDICYHYDNSYGKDITLKDRRNDIFQNVSFCQDGCIYNGFNYELKSANCLCDIIFLQDDEEEKNSHDYKLSKSLNFKSIKESFISNLLSFNFDIVKCYNLLLDVNLLKSNIGFFCLAIMLFIQIIFIFIFLGKRLKPIEDFMLKFGRKNKKNKKNKKVSIININSNISINNKRNNNKEYTKESIKSTPPPKNKKLLNINGDTKKIKLKNISIPIKNKLNNKEEIFLSNDSSKENLSQRKIKIKKSSIENSNENIESFNALSSFMFSKFRNNQKENIFLSNNNEDIKIYRPKININKNIKEESIKSEDQEFIKSNKIFKEEKNTFRNSQKIDNVQNENNRQLNNAKKEEIKLNSQIRDNEQKKENKSSKEKINYNRNKINKIKDENIKSFGSNSLIKIKKNKEDKHKSVINFYDLQDMDYEEAIFQDNRGYLKIYFGFIIDSQIIFGTFCTDNYLDLFVIKLSFLIFTFQISFFLNAFFYSDEYISDAYHNDGVLNFFSGLPKSIYSFIATLITTNLLRMLSSSKKELIFVIRERKKYENYLCIIKSKLSKLRAKLIIYFILVFLLELIFLYYVSVFCAVYKNSQKYWFFGFLESFGMDSLVSLIICIFLALFRYISIKKRIKYLYILANIISSFL